MKRRLAALKPIGAAFVNGIASSYDDQYPGDYSSEFADLVKQNEFDAAITKVNDALEDHWPCVPYTSFAYVCCLCTGGVSIYCAIRQVQEAKFRVNLQLSRINELEVYKRRGIEWKLVHIWYRCVSYIEITIDDGVQSL